MSKNHIHQPPEPNKISPKVFRIVGHVLVGIVFALLFAFVFALLVRLIWNSLMPAIFGLGQITYWQAFGIILLSKLLFGGFGSRQHDHWRKDEGSHPEWHKPWGESDAQGPPSHFDRNWEAYNQYWKEEGKAAFSAYVERLGGQ